MGNSAGAPGLFCVDANTSRFGLVDGTPRFCALLLVCACVHSLLSAGLGRPASWALFCAPDFSSGLFLCSPSLLCPLRAVVAGPCYFVFFHLALAFPPLLVCFLRPFCVCLSLVSSPRCPCPTCCAVSTPPSHSRPPPLFLLSFSCFCAPPLSSAFCHCRPRLPWELACGFYPHPPLFCVSAPPLFLAFFGLQPRVPWASALLVLRLLVLPPPFFYLPSAHPPSPPLRGLCFPRVVGLPSVTLFVPLFLFFILAAGCWLPLPASPPPTSPRCPAAWFLPFLRCCRVSAHLLDVGCWSAGGAACCPPPPPSAGMPCAGAVGRTFGKRW